MGKTTKKGTKKTPAWDRGFCVFLAWKEIKLRNFLKSISSVKWWGVVEDTELHFHYKSALILLIHEFTTCNFNRY